MEIYSNLIYGNYNSLGVSTNVLISVCEHADIVLVLQTRCYINAKKKKILLCCYITGLVISPWDRL